MRGRVVYFLFLIRVIPPISVPTNNEPNGETKPTMVSCRLSCPPL